MTDENKAPIPPTPPAEVIKVTDTVMEKVAEIVESDASPTPELLELMVEATDHVVVPLLNSVLGKTVFMTLGSIGNSVLHWVQPENPATIPGGIYISQVPEDDSDSRPTPVAQVFIDNARNVFQALIHDSEEALVKCHDLDLIPHGAEIVGHEMIAIHAQLQKSWA